jgi:hypothetical protein
VASQAKRRIHWTQLILSDRARTSRNVLAKEMFWRASQ